MLSPEKFVVGSEQFRFVGNVTTDKGLQPEMEKFLKL